MSRRSHSQRPPIPAFAAIRIVALLAAALPQLAAAAPTKQTDAEYRQWTDSTGRHRIEARFSGVAGGKAALKKRDGQETSVPLEKLSLADQCHVAVLMSRAAPGEGAKAAAKMPGSQGKGTPAQGPLADLDVLYVSRDPGSPTLHGKVDYPDLVPQLNERGKQVKELYLKPGTDVIFTGHVGNRGRAASGPFQVQWLLDGERKGPPIDVASLEPGRDAQVTLSWSWANGRHTVALVADPDGRIEEISKANNVRVDPIQGAGLVICLMPDFFQAFSQHKNMLGSFSPEDWVQWHIDDMNRKFAEAVYPSTPAGCHFRVRVDRLHAVRSPEEVGEKGRLYREFTQGSWTLSGSYENLWDKPDWGLIHELAHQLGLIDLYQLNHHPGNTLVERRDGTLLHSGYAYPTPETMMHWHGPHPFSEIDAAALNHQLRPDGRQSPRGWYGDYLLKMCSTYALRVLDRQGNPLANASVEMYQRSMEGVVPNKPAAQGETDMSGLWTIPNRKAPQAQTHGGFTYRDNPFNTISVVGTNGLVMFRVSYGGQEEVFWKNVTEFNIVAFRGQDRHTFDVRTTLAGPGAPQPPKNLRASYTSQGEIRLLWDPSPTPSVREYRVYVKEGRGSDGPDAYKPLPTTASAGRRARAGKTAEWQTEPIKLQAHMLGTFVVTAVDRTGRESSCSHGAVVPQIVTAHGLTVTPDGTVLLSDAHPHTGMIVALPNGLAGPDWMFMPGRGGDGRMLGLAIDAEPAPEMPYRMLAVNQYAHRVHFFDPQGRHLGHVGDQAGSGPGQFSAPSGVAVGKDGRFYVTDTGNRRIQVFARDGKFLSQFTGGEAGPTPPPHALQEPVGIAVDRSDRVYVADAKAGQVVVFEAGKPARAFGSGELQNPRWLALRDDGILAVSQPSRQEIALYTAQGKRLGSYTGRDAEHRLGRVQGIAFDRQGTLLIAAEDRGGFLERLDVPAPAR